MLHLGIVFNKELPSKGAMAAGARIARDAGGDGEVLAMSAGSSLEDAGFAIYEGGAIDTGVVGAARGWRLRVSLSSTWIAFTAGIHPNSAYTTSSSSFAFF